jgi:hypothetical protein
MAEKLSGENLLAMIASIVHLICLIPVDSPIDSAQWSHHGECAVLKVPKFSHHLKLELCNVVLPREIFNLLKYIPSNDAKNVSTESHPQTARG